MRLKGAVVAITGASSGIGAATALALARSGGGLVVRTARRPRRDAMVAPIRLVQLAEPLFGGLMDHAIGEARRRNLANPGRGARPEL